MAIFVLGITLGMFFLLIRRKRAIQKAVMPLPSPAYVERADPLPHSQPEIIYDRGESLPHNIHYPGAIIRREGQATQIRWEFYTEPRFGNLQFLVTVNELRLPGVYWGRGHCWSPCGNYFTFERFRGEQLGASSEPSSSLIVFSLERKAFLVVSGYATATYFNYPVLRHAPYGATSKEEIELVFTGNEDWQVIPEQ